MSNVKAMEPAEAAQAAAGTSGKSRGRLLVLLVVGVVALGGLGAGAWFLVPRLLGPADTAEARDAHVEERVKATVPLGAVVVNVAGESRRYLRVAVHLGVPSAKETKEIEESKAQILDLLIGALSSAEPDALLSEERRGQLKEELLGRIRTELGLKKVARVYFTEFVLQ